MRKVLVGVVVLAGLVMPGAASGTVGHLSVGRARVAILRYERTYWKHAASVWLGGCKQDSRTLVGCFVEVTGVFFVGQASPATVEYVDTATVHHGHLHVAVVS